MNKFIKLSVAVLAAGMFASCAENSADLEGASSAFDADGNAWMKMSINLPSDATMGTRAIGDYGIDDPTNPGYPGEYGEYNDGSKYEYAVENAILCIFSGAADGNDAEGDRTLIGAYQLGSGEWKDDTSAEITTNREFIQRINNQGANGGKLYAYVILNKHDFFEIDEAKNSLMFYNTKGATGIECVGKSMSEFEKLAIKESGRRYDTSSFMMTNMPYASVKGGNEKPTDGFTINTLYPINTAAIYPSQAAAEVGTAASEINVERVLAKVQTTWTYPGGKDYFETEDAAKRHVKILGWFIDNTNPNAFVGRHYKDPAGEIAYHQLVTKIKPTASYTPTYRFISRNYVTPGAFRTFWAIDANYDKKAGVDCDALITKQGSIINPTHMVFDPITGKNVGGDLRPQNSYYYCTENTFDVQHQSEFNTTRVVVAAQFGEEDPVTHKYPSFYTIAQEANSMYTLAEIKDYTVARIAERVVFQQWVADFCNSSVTDATQFIDIVIANPVKDGKETAGRATVSMNKDPKGFKTEMVRSDKSYTDAIAAYERMVVGDDTEGQELTGCNDYLSKNYVVNHYLEGVAYYYALIKHFGDDETPWVKADHAGVTNNVEGVYTKGENDSAADADANYLGRYGVVRNNWYFLNIEGVRQIGSAVVPVLPGNDPDTPDDQVENYLKVKINITPWVIRKQSVKL